LVHDAPNYRVPRVLSFARQDLPIDLPAIDAFRSRGRGGGVDELTLPELVRRAGAAGVSEADRRAVRANFHFRMAEIGMILLVPLLAVALAVPPKRSSSGLGIFLSLILVVVIHKVNQYAENMATQNRIDPVLALWGPFALFAALILWMFWTLAHKPGGQPIGGLERVFAKFGKWIGRLLDIGGAKRRARALQPAA
jgi:lipopolysaccharide export system permease protein